MKTEQEIREMYRAIRDSEIPLGDIRIAMLNSLGWVLGVNHPIIEKHLSLVLAGDGKGLKKQADSLDDLDYLELKEWSKKI